MANHPNGRANLLQQLGAAQASLLPPHETLALVVTELDVLVRVLAPRRAVLPAGEQRVLAAAQAAMAAINQALDDPPMIVAAGPGIDVRRSG